MSWVVVVFPERREVFCDDRSEGDTLDTDGKPRALLIGEGTHTFRLGGAPPCRPNEQTVYVPDAGAINPFRVVFEIGP